MFKISDLVNKVDNFRFEYDGFVLEGEYWKYRTTTPNYAKQFADIPEVPEEGTDDEKKEAESKRTEALKAFHSKTLSDTIKSWNAVDEQDAPLEPTIEVFEALPLPFTEAFMAHIRDLRENPTSPNSPSTS